MAGNDTHARSDTCVLILGMHRSGSSALAGSLREAGLYMGDVLDNGFALNPKGLQEPASLIYMHDDLLRVSGGSWSEPPAEITWEKLHKTVRDLFIESRRGTGLWGFKEPRTLLVAQGWIDVLSDWRAVGIFRHPVEVARSLHKRNGIALEDGLQLWRIYNDNLLGILRTHGGPVMEFTLDQARFGADVGVLIRSVGLTAPESSAFFDASIPTNAGVSESETLPADVARTLGALREIAVS